MRKNFTILILCLCAASLCHVQIQSYAKTDAVAFASVTFSPDSTLLPTSYYLLRAAKKQTQELLLVGGVALLGFVGAGQESDGSGRSLCFIGATVCGVVAFIKHIGAIYNLKLAGRSLERVHLQQGGIAIDL